MGDERWVVVDIMSFALLAASPLDSSALAASRWHFIIPAAALRTKFFSAPPFRVAGGKAEAGANLSWVVAGERD